MDDRTMNTTPESSAAKPRRGLRPGRRRLLMAALALGLALAAAAVETRRLDRLEPDETMVLSGFPELSGLAWMPRRGTLLAVSDEGFVGELSLDGNLVRRRRFEGRDLEGVMLVEGGETALLLDEGRGRLLRLRISDFEVLSESGLPAESMGSTSPNRSYEGLCAGPAPGSLTLLNEDPPVLAAWDRHADRVSVTDVLSCGMASAVMRDPSGRILVLLSRDSGLARMEGARIGAWRPVADLFLEGMALVPGVGLFVAVDRKPSRLLLFRSLDSWRKLLEALPDV